MKKTWWIKILVVPALYCGLTGYMAYDMRNIDTPNIIEFIKVWFTTEPLWLTVIWLIVAIILAIQMRMLFIGDVSY